MNNPRTQNPVKMKRKLIPALLVVATSLFLFAYTHAGIDNDDRKNQVLLRLISEILANKHYSPVMIDDSFSQKAFDLYLERIDFDKRFFVKSDLEQLTTYKQDLDNEFIDGSFQFFLKSLEIYTARIAQVEGWYQTILEQPFDFSTDEYFETDAEKRDYAADEKALYDYWYNFLKYRTLAQLTDLYEKQEEALKRNDTMVVAKSLEELEKQAREKVLRAQDDWARRVHRINEADRLSLYVNALIGIYDPHTYYFPPEDKENFDIALSGQLEGIGATLQENNGYVKVVRIVPGSASWKQGELQVNDLIMKVAQGANEPVDLYDMPLDEAVKLIRGPKGTTVVLTVKKTDGTVKEISIVRDIVILEETFAKSAILTDPKSEERFGYIYLPKFYVDFDNPKGRRCSFDVKKEIEKLKQDNVSGIILDLRDNGGGALTEAVDLAGLFIRQGPVVQVKSRFGVPNVMDDEDGLVEYEGNLIIMVNSLSASASEILAAAMQDYGRAVILGSRTFGKGTVQSFYSLDHYLRSSEKNLGPLGSLKLTEQKFYRINGGATQLKGVEPDIVLPDLYSYLDIRERDMDYCMPWTQIQPARYQQFATKYDIEKLAKKSKLRVSQNKDFTLIDQSALRYKELQDESLVSLNFEKYRAFVQKREDEAQKYDNLMKENNGLEIISNSTDLVLQSIDTLKAASAKEWHVEIGKDVYVKEAYLVMKDM